MTMSHDDLLSELSQLTELTYKARETPYPTLANEILNKQASSSANPLSPILRLWAADNLCMEFRFQEAIAVYRLLAKEFRSDQSTGTPLAVSALQGAADAHRASGEVDNAIEALTSAAEAYPNSPSTASLYYAAGELAEEHENDDVAKQTYSRAASSVEQPGQGGFSFVELANCALKRMDLGEKHVFPTANQLAFQLATLLQKKDAEGLRALASPSHFTFGFAGSERRFVEFEKLYTFFYPDLLASSLVADPVSLSGTGNKMYMPTQGWAGEVLLGRVYFVLTRYKSGWEWSGLACTMLPEAVEEILGRFKKETNQPLVIPIKAPWPEGRNFRAGGLGTYILQQALLGLPFGLGLLLTLAISANPCGFGPSGFYYNEGSTHNGGDAFAIDFTAYVPGLPYVDAAGGTSVLSAAAGLVSEVVGNRLSGDAMVDNHVFMAHGVTADESRATIVELIEGRPLIGARYTSRSLHLAGPRMVPVSRGMFIRQGVRLGVMDDTGNSALNHLHFAMNDRDSTSGPFSSVRPTPMSGQTLNDGENGKIILSDNRPF